MIAANYRRYADALIRQIELDLAPAAEAAKQTRDAWWTWLLQSGITQPAPAKPMPAWLKAMRASAKRIAAAIKAALLTLF